MGSVNDVLWQQLTEAEKASLLATHAARPGSNGNGAGARFSVGDVVDVVINGQVVNIGGPAMVTAAHTPHGGVYGYTVHGTFADPSDPTAQPQEREYTTEEGCLVAAGSASTAGGAGRYSTWADIAATLGPITWSWPGWLPDGMLTIVAAEPGIGKSALCLRIAATLIGHTHLWPDGTPYTAGAGRVVWAESESGQAINLERASTWGLDTARLIQPGLPLDDFRLDDPAKLQTLCELAFLSDVRAVVIDSLRGANSRNENDSDVITLVMKLAELARDCNKPILLTHHLRKRGLFDGDGPSLDRLRGSSAIVQPARVVWALDTPDPHDKETRRLSQVKNNLSRTPQPLGLTIGAAGVRFVDAPEAPRQISQQDAAINFLLALLATEALPADEVLNQAKLAGHSERTVKRAKDKIGVVSLKKGGGGGPWYWGLPAKS